MNTSVAAITVLAPNGRIVFANSRAEAMLGLTVNPLTQRTYNTPEWCATDLDGSAWPDEKQPFHQVLATGEPVYDICHAIEWPDGQRRMLSVNGAPVKGVDGQIVSLVFTINDITDQMQAERALHNSTAQLRLMTESNVTEKLEIQARLEYDANHDALTGLPNRFRLLQDINAALARAHHGRNDRCAILFIDLDRFKVINDSLGHHVGDGLLVAIAHKLNTITRPGDIAARLSGDEFVLLLRQVPDLNTATQVAERLLDELRQPFTLDDRDVVVTASIGIALSTLRHQTGADLLRDADIAMYRAKALGRGHYALFDPQMHLAMLRQLHLEEALRQAIEHQDLVLYYQPIVDLSNGHIKGFEVLARWPHREYGLISPAEFIPIAEETGLIIPLGRWILRAACSQFSQWWHRFPAVRAMGLNINLSVVQLHDANVVTDLTQLLTHLGLPNACLTLEITESLLIDNVDYNLAVLEQIRAQGIQLSIDDFGTGYSSLSYLHRFPFGELKIDRSFVTHLGTEASNPTLVKSILTLADSLKLAPIAEGIETAKQLEFLQANGCCYGQGFLFYKPMPTDQIEALLANDAPHQNHCQVR
jgi:diguanylate cyclase (GGDEF)-like protein/PAS domain S-box-containing protein